MTLYCILNLLNLLNEEWKQNNVHSLWIYICWLTYCYPSAYRMKWSSFYTERIDSGWYSRSKKQIDFSMKVPTCIYILCWPVCDVRSVWRHWGPTWLATILWREETTSHTVWSFNTSLLSICNIIIDCSKGLQVLEHILIKSG